MSSNATGSDSFKSKFNEELSVESSRRGVPLQVKGMTTVSARHALVTLVSCPVTPAALLLQQCPASCRYELQFNLCLRLLELTSITITTTATVQLPPPVTP